VVSKISVASPASHACNSAMPVMHSVHKFVGASCNFAFKTVCSWKIFSFHHTILGGSNDLVLAWVPLTTGS